MAVVSRWTVLRVALLLSLLVGTGCSSAYRSGGAPAQAPKSAPGDGAAAPGTSSTTAEAARTATSRKLIKNAAMTVSVVSVQEAWTKVRKMTEEAGGFVSSSSTDGADEESRSATLQVKVPAERLDAVMESVGALGRVRSRSEQAEDVTAQYLDMEARLRNLQREEVRLLDLLQKAGNVKDLLEVERELSRVRGEIERLQTELKHIDDRVAYSTLTITLTTSATAGTGSGFWDVGETFGNAWYLFRVLLISVIRGGIYLMFLLPFIVPLAWWWRRARKRRPAPPPMVGMYPPTPPQQILHQGAPSPYPAMQVPPPQAPPPQAPPSSPEGE